MKKFFAAIAFAGAMALAFVSTAAAQSGCPTIITGAVLTAAQWQQCFQSKNDALGFTPLNVAGGTMSGRLVTAAPGATLSGLNLTPGTAPGSPADGDTWTTTAGFFARINGNTYNLISPASTCPFCAMTNAANTFGQIQTIDIGSGAAPVFDTGTILGINGGNGVAARVEITAFGAAAIFSGRYGGNTRASPAAPTAGTLLADLNAKAYDTSVWTGIGAALHLYAEGSTWTASSHPGEACLATTPTGSVSAPTDGLCQHQSGGLTTGAATDQGAGTLNLAGSLYNNGTAPTGTGGYVRATSPALVTPTLGAATATSINKLAITQPATGATLTIADGKTHVVSNSLTFTGADATSFAFPGTSDTVVTLTATQTQTNKTLTSPVLSSTTPTAAGALGFGTFVNYGDGSVNHALVDVDRSQTLSGKTINGASNTLTVRLGSDVTGNLPVSNLNGGASATSSTFWRGDGIWATPAGGGNVSTTGTPVANQIAQWTSATVVQGVNLASLLSSPYGITIGGTTSPTLAVSLTTLSNALSGDIALGTSYVDGPSVAQGTSGGWQATGAVTISDPTNQSVITCKLWDGTTVINSTGPIRLTNIAAFNGQISLSGFLNNPASNIKISCKSNTTTSLMKFNLSGESKDSVLTVHRTQ